MLFDMQPSIQDDINALRTDIPQRGYSALDPYSPLLMGNSAQVHPLEDFSVIGKDDVLLVDELLSRM